MNRTEQMEDGTILMTVEVDGKEQKRRCHIEVNAFSWGPQIAKPIPELRAGEQLVEMIGGEIKIITVRS